MLVSHASPPMPLLRLQLSLCPPPISSPQPPGAPPLLFCKHDSLIHCLQHVFISHSSRSHMAHTLTCSSFPLSQLSFFFTTHTPAGDPLRQSARCQSAHGSLNGLRVRGSLYGVPGGSLPSVRYHQFTLGYRQSVRRSPFRIALSTSLCQSSASSLVGGGILACGCRRTGVSANHLGSPVTV